MKSLSLDGYNFWVTPMDQRGLILTPVDKIINPAVIAQQIQRELQTKRLKYVHDVIATSEEIFISSKRYKKAIKEIEKIPFEHVSVSEWEIPIWFDDNTDWKEVLLKSSYTREGYIRNLIKGNFTVRMMGFLPGFVYIDGLPEEMCVSRKSKPVYNPTPRVLAVGGPYLGIYNLPSPSGWYILGRIPIALINKKGDQPLPFNIQDRLVFKSIAKKEFTIITKRKLNIRSYNA